jgi:CheY-like chemotaxis protein
MEMQGPSGASPRGEASLPLRILVAEDNPVNRKLLLLLLERLGHAVDNVNTADAVANGSEALDALRGKRYDLVFMDVQMPVMDGLEATRRIVAGEVAGGFRPRIVAMIASDRQADLDACLAAGMDECLGKPLRLDELRAVLLRASRRPAEPLFDPACLDRLRQLEEATGQAIVGEVVGHFLESAPLQVEAIREALAAGDVETLGFTAHALKGSSAQLGARHLAALAQELEVMARSAGAPSGEGTLPAVSAVSGITALRAELDRLVLVLTAWR